MPDFNIRLLGKELDVDTYQDQLLESRKNTEVVSVKNSNNPTSRTLKKVNLFEFNQAYLAKASDSNSLPIFTGNNVKDGSNPATQVSRVINFSGSIRSLQLDFSISNSSRYCYCQVNVIGNKGYIEAFGDFIPDVYYDFHNGRVFISYLVAEATISVMSIKVYGVDTKVTGWSKSDSTSGNQLPCNLFNGNVRSGAFDDMPNTDLIPLDDSYPSLVVWDNSTRKFYAPPRSEIYGAINKTRTCTIDITNESSTADFTKYYIDGTSILAKDWVGDLVIILEGTRSSYWNINESAIRKSGRLLTIINHSNFLVRYSYNSSSYVEVQSYMECLDYQGSGRAPILYYENKVSYSSARCQVYAKSGSSIVWIEIPTTLPRLPYIRPANSDDLLLVPRVTNALSFVRILTSNAYNRYGILYENGSSYFSEIYNTYEDVVPTVAQVTSWLSLYRNMMALDLASTNWNANSFGFNRFNFIPTESGYQVLNRYFSLS